MELTHRLSDTPSLEYSQQCGQRARQPLSHRRIRGVQRPWRTLPVAPRGACSMTPSTDIPRCDWRSWGRLPSLECHSSRCLGRTVGPREKQSLPHPPKGTLSKCLTQFAMQTTGLPSLSKVGAGMEVWRFPSFCLILRPPFNTLSLSSYQLEIHLG